MTQSTFSQAIRDGLIDLKSQRFRSIYRTYPLSKNSVCHPFRTYDYSFLAVWPSRLASEGWTREQIADWVEIVEAMEGFRAEFKRRTHGRSQS